MLNNLFSMMNPQMQQQMQQQVQYHVQQARLSGNPEQYVKRVFGNDPRFSEGYNLFNEQGIQGLQNFIASNMK